MDLKRFRPESMNFFSEDGIQHAVKMILMRANFVPAARHVLGWRGATDISYTVLGWTARIKGYQGVFGLAYDQAKISSDWLGGVFRLHYFPWPGEDLIENYSVRAAFLTEESDYMKHVRNFLEHPDFALLFHIADLAVAVHRSEEALLCGIDSLSEHRVVADDGVDIIKDGQLVRVVEPGACDQRFPSFRTGCDFFHVFAASVTFNCEEPPRFFMEKTYPGHEVHYDNEGGFEHRANTDITNRYLSLGYGDGDFLAGFEKVVMKKHDEVRDTFVWRSGETGETGFEGALWWTAHRLEEARHVDETSIGIEPRVPLVVVSGFLGSGKTSFIQSFINFHVQRNRFVAVIQNEIGEIGLDGKILEDEYAVTEIDEGCVCCSLIGSVKKAVTDILAQFQPDFIILETTGMANPFNLLDEIVEIMELVRFDGVTTIVDAANIETSMDQYDIAVRQVEAADILVVNKTDLVSEKNLSAVTSRLREKNTRAPVIVVEHGYINPALLYGTDPDEAEIDINAMTAKSVGVAGTHSDDGLESRKLVLPTTVHRKKFLSLLESFPVPAFRIKGIVRFDDYERPCILQYVNGRYDISDSHEERFDEPFIVVIGRDIAAAPLDGYFEAAAAGQKLDT